jgi:hypothetical protein
MSDTILRMIINGVSVPQREYIGPDGLEMVELLPIYQDELPCDKLARPAFPFRVEILRFLGGRNRHEAAFLWEFLLMHEQGGYVALNRERAEEATVLGNKYLTGAIRLLQRRGYAFGDDLVRIDKDKFNREYSDWIFYRTPDGDSRRFKDWETQQRLDRSEQLAKDAR